MHGVNAHLVKCLNSVLPEGNVDEMNASYQNETKVKASVQYGLCGEMHRISKFESRHVILWL